MKLRWLEEIEEILPEILAVVKKCDEPFQQKCFEILLTHALKALGEPKEERAEPSQMDKSTSEAPTSSHGFTQKYQMFLKQNNLREDDINRLIELKSGEILISDLMKKDKAKKQRILAVLIALRHYAIDGEFKVPKDELIEQCKQFDAYDRPNFARNMKNTTHNKSKVFIQKDDGWVVSDPGRAFVVKTIKELLGLSESS
jgi:hypothetical protein